MRSENDVLELEQPLLDLRLPLVDVERGTRDRACPERVDERTLVHDRPAGDVDEHRGRTHRRERRGVDQVARGVGKRDVQADDVRAAEQLAEIVVPPRERGPRTERLGQAGRLAADAPGPDDEEILPVEARAEHELEGELPRRPAPHESVALGDPT